MYTVSIFDLIAVLVLGCCLGQALIYALTNSRRAAFTALLAALPVLLVALRIFLRQS